MNQPGPIAQSLMSASLFDTKKPTDLPLRQRVGLEIADLKEATKVIVENHYLHRGRTMGQIARWSSLWSVSVCSSATQCELPRSRTNEPH